MDLQRKERVGMEINQVTTLDKFLIDFQLIAKQRDTNFIIGIYDC